MTLELLSGIYNNFKITIKTNILFPSYIFLFFFNISHCMERVLWDSYYLGTNENVLSSPAKIQKSYLSEVMIHSFIHSFDKFVEDPVCARLCGRQALGAGHVQYQARVPITWSTQCGRRQTADPGNYDEVW